MANAIAVSTADVEGGGVTTGGGVVGVEVDGLGLGLAGCVGGAGETTISPDGDGSLRPPHDASRVDDLPATCAAPAPGCPVELVFQVPLDGTRLLWSSPIRFRYINEDTNGNAALDPGEDVDGDGALTRRIVRMQDINGDGDEDDPGEQRPLAAANDLSDVQFALDADHSLLTIRLEASARTSGRRMERVTAAVTSRVYVCN